MKSFFIAEIFATAVSTAFIPAAAFAAQDGVAVTDTLQEVVVTAEKREESLQRTPVAITALSAQELAVQGRDSMEEALRTVAGVYVKLDANPSSTKVNIRGIQPPTTTDSAVSINVDGVYQSNTSSSPQFDTSRIEVLKGPQGTLYGRNATAGVVNIINNDPTDQLGGSVSLRAGNYAARRAEAAFNLPLGTSVSSRFSALYSKRNGYLSNGANDDDTVAGRAKFLFTPSDTLRLVLTGEVDRRRGVGAGSVLPVAGRSDPWQTPDPVGGFRLNKSSVYATLDWTMPFGVLTVLPSYYELDTVQDVELTGADQGLVQNSQHYRQSTYEVRLSQPATSRVKWQIGYYRLDYNATPYLRAPLVEVPVRSAAATGLFQPFLTTAQALAAPGTPFRRPIGAGGQSSTIVGNQAWAAFGQTTIPVTDALRLTAGLRYTNDDKSRQNRIVNAFGVESSPYAAQVVTNSGATPCTVPLTSQQCYQSAQFHATTWKAGAEYDLSPKWMTYADVAKGFKAGGLNFLPVPAGFSDSYAPEYVTAIELGSKSRFLDDRLQINVDVYHYDYRDKQIVVTFPPLPPNPLPTVPVLNVGKATLYGLEAAAEWLLTPSDRVSATMAYAHTRVDQAPPDTFAYLIGEPLPNAPLWTEILGYDHTFRIPDTGSLSLGGSIRFYSSAHVDINYTRPDSIQPAYHQSDLHLNYAPQSERWSVGAFVDNVENEVVRSSAFSGTRYLIEPPRTFGVNATMKF